MSEATKIAAEALEKRARELLDERRRVRRRILEDAVRDQEVDRDVAGCIAGAKALGVTLDLPGGPDFSAAPKAAAFTNFINGRNMVAQIAGVIVADYGGGLSEDEGEEEAALSDRPEMPRIADIIVEQLTIAGAEGSKAAAIRRFILDTYNADIHEKTVGMTLYRLQNQGLVRRDGHTWFLASV